MKRFALPAVLFGVLLIGAGRTLSASPVPHVVAGSQLDAGRYIVLTAGCNHCHTQGWEASNGTVPQSGWLKGGIAPPNIPAPNLRAFVHVLPRESFVALFRAKQAPSAMPWFDLRNLSDADLDAVYAFIHALK